MSILHDTDFYSWTLQQAALLQMGEVMALDRINLIAELEDMGVSQYRELEHRLCVLLMHLLKWQYQAALQSRSWAATVRVQRNSLKKLLRKSPSLKAVVAEVVADAYENARIYAAAETDLAESVFPAVCQWSFAQIMDDAFWPTGVS